MMRVLGRKGIVIVLALLIAGARSPNVVLNTTFGEIELQLAVKEAHQHSRNFFLLSWLDFYDGLTFHRLVPGFVIQGGDPAGNGSGGPGYTVPAEIGLRHDEGALAAARTGDQVNPRRESSGSQFYIAVAPTPQLDGAYSVYGKTVKGIEVVKSIVGQPRGELDRPLTPIIIKFAKIQSQAVTTCDGWELGNDARGVRLVKRASSVTVAQKRAPTASLYCEPVVRKEAETPVAVTATNIQTTVSVFSVGDPPTALASLSLESARKPALWDLDGDGIKEILLLQSRALSGKAATALGSKITVPIVLCVKDGKLTECTSAFKAVALAYRGLGIKKLIAAGADHGIMLAASAMVWIGNQWLGRPGDTAQILSQFCKTCADDLKPYEGALSDMSMSVIRNMKG
jgi:cyclophilin family peptidyl-prolyl cis-trans isomerase